MSLLLPWGVSILQNNFSCTGECHSFQLNWAVYHAWWIIISNHAIIFHYFLITHQLFTIGILLNQWHQTPVEVYRGIFYVDLFIFPGEDWSLTAEYDASVNHQYFFVLWHAVTSKLSIIICFGFHFIETSSLGQTFSRQLPAHIIQTKYLLKLTTYTRVQRNPFPSCQIIFFFFLLLTLNEICHLWLIVVPYF